MQISFEKSITGIGGNVNKEWSTSGSPRIKNQNLHIIVLNNYIEFFLPEFANVFWILLFMILLKSSRNQSLSSSFLESKKLLNISILQVMIVGKTSVTSITTK